jgi:hypothetical protein
MVDPKKLNDLVNAAKSLVAAKQEALQNDKKREEAQRQQTLLAEAQDAYDERMEKYPALRDALQLKFGIETFPDIEGETDVTVGAAFQYHEVKLLLTKSPNFDSFHLSWLHPDGCSETMHLELNDGDFDGVFLRSIAVAERLYTQAVDRKKAAAATAPLPVPGRFKQRFASSQTLADVCNKFEAEGYTIHWRPWREGGQGGSRYLVLGYSKSVPEQELKF